MKRIENSNTEVPVNIPYVGTILFSESRPKKYTRLPRTIRTLTRLERYILREEHRGIRRSGKSVDVRYLSSRGRLGRRYI